MTDRYAELRAALNEGPTPGPWAWDDDSRIATVASVSQYRIGPDYETSSQATYEYHADCSVDAAYIAAANPDTIRALLAERDALREVAQAALAYDSAIQSCANNPDAMSSFCTAEGDDLDSLYADWISKARAALSQEQGD